MFQELHFHKKRESTTLLLSKLRLYSYALIMVWRQLNIGHKKAYQHQVYIFNIFHYVLKRVISIDQDDALSLIKNKCCHTHVNKAFIS